MKRVTSAAIAWLFLAASALAQQPIVGGSEGDVSAGSVAGGLGNYGSQIAAGAANDTNFPPIPASGTIDKLYVALAVAPGAGNSRTFTLRKTGADQSLSCVIVDAATTCNDVSNSFSVTAGDVTFISISGSGSPSASSGQWSVKFTPTTADQTIVMARHNLLGNGATEYIATPQMNTMGASVIEADMLSIIGTGAINAIYFSSNGSPGIGNSYVFAVSKNSSAQAVTCSVSAGTTTCNDTAHSFSTLDGDTITIQNAQTGSPGLIRGGFGYRFTPTTPKNFYFSGGSRLIDNGTTAYLSPNGRVALVTAEANAVAVAPMAFYMTKIAILTGDPSPGSRAFTLRVNGADTALTCTVTSGNTTCSGLYVSGVTLAAGDLFTISDVASGGAIAGRPNTLLVGQSSAPGSPNGLYFMTGGL